MAPAIDLQLLVTFAAVADHASFSKAAAKLGVAKATVSRAIAELEGQLGVELVHRTTHHVALSTAGAELLERTRPHLLALRTAVAALPEREEAPSGLLRLTAPPDFGALVLPPVLAGFSRRFPKVRFDVRLTAAVVDLVKEGFDLALRISAGRLTDSSLTVRKLGRMEAAFYAAPSYLARRGRPKSVDDPAHAWVLHGAVPRRIFAPSGVSAAFEVDDFILARDLLREGVGVGVLPKFVARPLLRDGLLEEVPLRIPHLPATDLRMLYPSSGHTPRKVAAFRDYLVEALRAGSD